MGLEIKQLTRLQIIRYCEKLEKENEKLKEKLSEVTMVADDEKQSIEHILELEQENQTLKDKIEFLTNCLDDRDKSIAILQEEKKTNLVGWIVAILVLVVLRGFGIAFLNR